MSKMGDIANKFGFSKINKTKAIGGMALGAGAGIAGYAATNKDAEFNDRLVPGLVGAAAGLGIGATMGTGVTKGFTKPIKKAWDRFTGNDVLSATETALKQSMFT
jgi:hypothetical protein